MITVRRVSLVAPSLATRGNASTIASGIHGAAAKNPPVDADEFGFTDSAASWALKKITWAQIKTALTTFFNTLFVPFGRTISAAGLATGGGDLSANRTITVPKASGAEAAAGVDDTKAITPLALATPLAAKAPLASPAFTGNPTAPTAAPGDNDTSIATTAFVTTAVAASSTGKAPINSPAFTGNPTAPTPAPGDADTSIATTAFVSDAVAAEAAARASADATKAPLASPNFTGNPTAPTATVGDNDTSIATTAFVQAAVNAVLGGVSSAYDTLAELAAAVTALLSRTITGGGLATGGGDLSANRVITVAKASGAEVAARTIDDKAVTPFGLDAALDPIDAAVLLKTDKSDIKIPAYMARRGGFAKGRPTRISGDGTAAIVVEMQRPDGSFVRGPFPFGDWRFKCEGPEGARNIYARAFGFPEVRISTPGHGVDHDWIDDNSAPYCVRWLAQDPTLTPPNDWVEKTAVMAIGLATLPGNITKMHSCAAIGQSGANGSVNAIDGLLYASAPSNRLLSPPGGVRALGNEMGSRTRYDPLLDFLDFILAKDVKHLNAGTTQWPAFGIQMLNYELSNEGWFLSTFAIGGRSYAEVKKGTVPFANRMREIELERLAALSSLVGRTYDVPFTPYPWHENDMEFASSVTVAHIVEAQADHEAETIKRVPEMEGQTIPLVTDALGGPRKMAEFLGGGQTTPTVPWGLVDAMIANPTKILLVGGRYDEEHLDDETHRRGTAGGLGRSGYKWARAWGRAKAAGVANAQCVYMLQAKKTASNKVLVKFNCWVGYEPIRVNNDGLIAAIANNGFEYGQTGGSAPTISSMVESVTDTGREDGIEITFSGTVDLATNPYLTIASQWILGAGPSGAHAGPRSLISDSAPDGVNNYATPQKIFITA